MVEFQFSAPTHTIQNPANPLHFMALKPVSQVLQVRVGSTVLAKTQDAIFLVEFGKTVYEPRVYFPMAALKYSLDLLNKTTVCPLKGEAQYWAFQGREIGWSYKAFPFARAIEGFICMLPEEVSLTIDGAREI